MSLRKAVRRYVVERLPTRYRLAAERTYLYHYYGDAYVARDARIFRQLCSPERVALDIGANWGLMTLFLSRYSRHVYSFEPVPWVCEKLKRKFEGSNVSVMDFALGDVAGELPISIPWVGGTRMETRSSLSKDFRQEEILGAQVTEVEQVKVKVRRLDDLNIADIGFIKMDVEGFEMSVLRGATQTLRANRPNMVIEVEGRHQGAGSVYQTFDYLASLGYFGYFIYRNKMLGIREFDCSAMQDVAHEKNNALYVNNFIFSTRPDLTLTI